MDKATDFPPPKTTRRRTTVYFYIFVLFGTAAVMYALIIAANPDWQLQKHYP